MLPASAKKHSFGRAVALQCFSRTSSQRLIWCPESLHSYNMFPSPECFFIDTGRYKARGIMLLLITTRHDSLQAPQAVQKLRWEFEAGTGAEAAEAEADKARHGRVWFVLVWCSIV